MEEFKEDIIYILLVFINFLFIFNLMIFSYAVLDFSYLISFSYVLAAVLIFILLKYGIRKMLLKLIFLLVSMISAAYYIFINKSWIMSRLVNDFNNINNNISNNQAISFNNLYIILIIIIPLIIIALLLYSRGIYISISVLTLSFVLFLWYTGYTEEIIQYIFKYTFVNVFTLVVINYIKNKKIFRKKDVKVKTSIFSILIYGVILAVIFSSFVRILPKEYNGRLTSKSYSYFQNKFEKKTEKASVSEKYNISYSGYNDSSTSLGGPIKLDSSKALEVYGGNYLYLRGNVKDYYTGSSWISKINSYRIDNESVIYSRELINSSIASVRIKPIGLITSTVFSPPASTKVDNDDKQVFADNYGCFLREKPYNTEYTVSFYDGIKMVDDYKSITSKGYKTSSVMGTNYLQVPDTVPEEVFRLVRDIVDKNKAVSNYDKVICLKKYLEDNYKYTLDAKELPEGADFVDNFLFKEKQGYCTYFASALAIMCRIADVPAIYVEGFKQSGSSIVTNNMAHAWVEVNLTGDSMWLIADPSPTAYQNSIADVNKPESEKGSNIPKKENTNNTDIGKTPDESESEKTLRLSKNTIITLLIIFIFLLSVLSKILFILIRKRKLINNKSVIPLMLYSLKRLRRLGIKKGETEGCLEYAERIKDKELGYNMILLSKSYCSEAFGNKKTEIDKKHIYKFIESKIRKEKGLIKYYLDKILR